MALLFDVKSPSSDQKEEPRCVVKVETSKYFDKNGFVFKKQVRQLKRKSHQLNIHSDVLIEIEDIDLIINLHDVPDGVYELTWVNVSYDYETGYADDWEYELVPYNEER